MKDDGAAALAVSNLNAKSIGPRRWQTGGYIKMASDQNPAAEPLDHFIKKDGYWYRPNKCGYTKDIIAAGRYTKADAELDAGIEPCCMRAVPLSSFRQPMDEEATAAEFLRGLGYTVTAPEGVLA